MSVRVTPGATALMRMPALPHSDADLQGEVVEMPALATA